MAQTDFDTKLTKLREIYNQPEDQRLIDDTEKRIRELIAQAVQQDQLLDDPIVAAILTDSKKKVREINFLLAYNADLNAPTEEAQRLRYGLFRERSIHQFYLDRFGVRNIEEELASLDKFMDSKLN